MNPSKFRERLTNALSFDVHHDGSLYLNVLACVYLAAPEAAEPALGHEYYRQAEAEQVDGDQVLTDILLAVLA